MQQDHDGDAPGDEDQQSDRQLHVKGNLTPPCFFKSVAVSGHAAMPENSANQPFVIGKGPWCTRSARPPMPASNAQAHATVDAITRPTLFIVLPRSLSRMSFGPKPLANGADHRRLRTITSRGRRPTTRAP